MAQVAQHSGGQRPSVAAVADLLRRAGPGVVALTGAGCSTESGIPDYRSPTGLYRREGFKPLTWQRFHGSEWERRRYWCRSVLGYSFMSHAAPNAGHMALHRLSQHGVVRRILTQNVDGLHHLAANGGCPPSNEMDDDVRTTVYTASSAPLQELHGNIHMVACMGCRRKLPRRELQQRLVRRNKRVLDAVKAKSSEAMPDGDYAADDEIVQLMELDACELCGGEWRPDVVLFGENVPSPIVEQSFAEVESGSALVCLGTSLQVYSAFRFVEKAHKLQKPLIIINNGATRGDALATLKVDEPSVATFLKELEAALVPPTLRNVS